MTPVRKLARLKYILDHQASAKFGADYQPSGRATREQTPSLSYGNRLARPRLGRDAHAHSNSELFPILFALYNPDVLDLHEQKMLSRFPAPHPLTGFPGVDESALPPVRGTLQVADALGYHDFHDIVYVLDPDNKKDKHPVAMPLVGDILLFIRRQDNEPYCVNWSVKDIEDAFKSAPPTKSISRRRDHEKVVRRQKIETIYYQDAATPTVQLAAYEDIPLQLRCNLELMALNMNNPLSAEGEQHKELILDMLLYSLNRGIAPMFVFERNVIRNDFFAQDVITLLHRYVWERKLRVDLFQPFFTDHPLPKEECDALLKFKHWFQP